MEARFLMPELLDFYTELAEHNEKSWFDGHKRRYLDIKAYYESLGMEILEGLCKFDPNLEGLGPGDISWRIYQDQRFYNRPPYKTWLGLYFAKGGKKSSYPGYYFHIEPSVNSFFLCAGIWREEKLIVKSVREDIMLNGAEFDRCANPGNGWHIDWDGALTRPAKGWPADGAYSKYFCLKHYLIMKPLKRDYLLRPNLAGRVVRDFKPATDFVQLLNRPVDFAMEEWM